MENYIHQRDAAKLRRIIKQRGKYLSLIREVNDYAKSKNGKSGSFVNISTINRFVAGKEVARSENSLRLLWKYFRENDDYKYYFEEATSDDNQILGAISQNIKRFIISNESDSLRLEAYHYEISGRYIAYQKDWSDWCNSDRILVEMFNLFSAYPSSQGSNECHIEGITINPTTEGGLSLLKRGIIFANGAILHGLIWNVSSKALYSMMLNVIEPLQQGVKIMEMRGITTSTEYGQLNPTTRIFFKRIGDAETVKCGVLLDQHQEDKRIIDYVLNRY